MKLPLSVKLYVGIVSIAALLVVIYTAPHLFILLGDKSVAVALAIFSIITVISEIYEIELMYGRHTSTAIAFCIAAILLGGVPLAAAVALTGTLAAEIILRWGRLTQGYMNFVYRVSFNTGQFILSAFASSSIFMLLGGKPLIADSNMLQDNLAFYNQLIPATGAFIVFALTNTSLVSGVLALYEKTEFSYHLRFTLRHLLLQIFSLGVLGILLAVVYAQSPWNLLLVLVPLGMVHASLRNYMKLRNEATKTFHRISEMLDARDRYTYEHSHGVADLAERISRKLKLNQDQIEQSKSAAVIHDIGKVAVPDKILQKPGPLTDDEWIIMKKHPDTGAELLRDLEMYRDIIDIVRHEHEHWDGSGYPKGLKGEEIPIGARIVAAADIYHALTTDRPYRPAYSHDEALEILQQMRGSVLEPKVVDALRSVLENIEAEATLQKKTATS